MWYFAWCFILSPSPDLVLFLVAKKTGKLSTGAAPDIFPGTSGPTTFGFRPETEVFAVAAPPLILCPVHGDKTNSNLIPAGDTRLVVQVQELRCY